MSGTNTQSLERISTGIEKLDLILNGGFLATGTYMIVGTPGAGKTILGNQICFNHVKQGGHAVFITLLAETHARMLAHIRNLAFFDSAVVGDSLYYISGYSALETDGLPGLLRFIRQVVRERRASLLVMDGLATAEVLSDKEIDFRRFLHELQVFAETSGCTMILLTQPGPQPGYAEHTMVDGMITLYDRTIGPRAIRELEIGKLRGSGYLRGKHAFEITDQGIEVHPRTEMVFSRTSPTTEEARSRVAFGIPLLDSMLLGGVLSRSTTALLGAQGSGKTVLGLHFIYEGARRGENGLYFGFYETPARLVAKAAQIGMDIGQYIEDGLIRIIRHPALEHQPDALAEELVDSARAIGARRVFIDGVEVFNDSLVYPERGSLFFTALTNELRELGATTLLAAELPDVFGPRVAFSVPRMASIVDNIIFLRYVQLRSQLYRLISILKMRESTYDPSIREFRINGSGIEVASTFESAEAILTGTARPLPPGNAPYKTGSALMNEQHEERESIEAARDEGENSAS
jgi:circadian clock protein KaiC